MNFTEKDYYRATFSKLTATGETVTGKTFEKCEFERCSFVDCRFEKCKFLDCKFTECTLSAISPTNTRFLEVSFAKSKVIGCDWTLAAKLEELTFTGCQLNYSNFSMLKLPKIKITDCEVKEVDFIETDLSNGVFTNTDFEKSRFFKTNLSHADFKGAHNYYIDVRNNTLKQTRFSLPEALALLNSLDIVLD